MKIIVKVMLILLVPSIAMTQVKPIKIESEFKLEKNEYKIKARVNDAANYIGNGQIIYYSIYKNKKFVHPRDWDGGNITGCRYPFSTLEDNFEIKELKFNDSSIGWIISTGGNCGNTHSLKCVLILPPINDTNTGYIEHEIFAKRMPIIKSENGKIEVWYIYQDWGWGGTASSIFVPQKIVIDPVSQTIEKGNVFDGILELKTEKWGFYKIHFLSLFVAGLNDLNMELMEYSLSNLYNPKEVEWYSSFFGKELLVSKKDLKKVIDDTKFFKLIYNKYKHYSNWSINK